MSPNPLGDRLEHLAQSVAERVVNLVLEAIDIDALIDQVDIDRIVQKVDIDAIIERVDIDRIIQRVDVDAIIERVDINQVVGRVDLNAVVSQIDMDSLVENTELGSIIAKSTTGVMTEVLDLLRSQAVGLDDFFARWTARIMRRDPGSLPLGPPLLVGAASPTATGDI